MNILLDAYLDQNFGDDLFVETILNLFPEHRFYAFLEYYPEEVCGWAARFPNLYQLPECSVFLEKDLFDAYVCVGGDIFPDGGDFGKRKSCISAVRRCGGAVAFLGFSLFREYSASTREDICEMMGAADIVAPRDESSAELLRSWLPGISVRPMPDTAFCSSWEGCRKMQEKLLGVSVRKLSGDKGNEEKYCAEIAGMINAYLKRDPARKAMLLCLSGGTVRDRETADRILEMLEERDRVELQLYQGDLLSYKQILGQCEVMACTRLHAMIACIAMKIPFLPVVYEVKQENILEDAGYWGDRFSYHDMEGIGSALERILSQKDTQNRVCMWDTALTGKYRGQALERIEELRRLLKRRCETGTVYRQGNETGTVSPQGRAVCSEKEYGRQQAQEVARKNEELFSLAQEAADSRKTIKECQDTMEQYLRTIQECNQVNSEYFRLIEDLNQRIHRMETDMSRQADELRHRDEVWQGRIKEVQCLERRQREILDRIEPYFTVRGASRLTKAISLGMKGKNPRAPQDWEEIRAFFEEAGRGKETENEG